jgi:hypothetical protein
MAQILEGGSLTFDSLAYGRPHPGTQQFLTAQLDRATNYLTSAGQQFMAGVHDLYDRLSGSTAARMLRAAGRGIRSMWQLDEIRAVQTIGDFQHAPPMMQRWIMADPMLRAMYIDQRIDGYSETYVDVDPGKVGEAHYDYRRATDGLIFDNPDDDGWTATTYFEELLPDDVELTLEEQVDIQNTWAWMREVIKQGKEDPTSRFNADLN